ncbi:MAG TPA: hypothetical protein VFH68_17340 [Polyangia bacterium]|jgi:hypothetical protein|nr:hypothetical protein [Polyangia bacterium]
MLQTQKRTLIRRRRTSTTSARHRSKIGSRRPILDSSLDRIPKGPPFPDFERRGCVAPAAKEARRAVDDEREREREELKEAEKVGKFHRADIVGDGGVGAPVKKR